MRVEALRIQRDLTWQAFVSTAEQAVKHKALRTEAAPLRTLLSAQVSIELFALNQLSTKKNVRLVATSLARLPTESLLQLEVVNYLAAVTKKDAAVSSQFSSMKKDAWRPVQNKIDGYLK